MVNTVSGESKSGHAEKLEKERRIDVVELQYLALMHQVIA
jgi:hypothetical protein